MTAIPYTLFGNTSEGLAQKWQLCGTETKLSRELWVREISTGQQPIRWDKNMI